MDKDFNIQAVSSADSAQVQEQSVNGSQSSSNLNIAKVEDADVIDLDIYSCDFHSGHPAVYVGSYAKYNDGNIFGKWFDLMSFADYDEFCEACHHLHAAHLLLIVDLDFHKSYTLNDKHVLYNTINEC